MAKAKAVEGLPFTKLYKPSVLNICNYSSHVWVYRKQVPLTKIQNGTLRFFFGIRTAVPIAALVGGPRSSLSCNLI